MLHFSSLSCWFAVVLWPIADQLTYYVVDVNNDECCNFMQLFPASVIGAYQNAMRYTHEHYTVSPKKEATKLLAITFSNLNRFSKFFHCWKEDEYFSYCQKFGGFLFWGHGVVKKKKRVCMSRCCEYTALQASTASSRFSSSVLYAML